MEVMKKLQKIQLQLKAPKSQYNAFGKYNYRNAEDILEAVKPLLAEQGCVLTINDEINCVEGRHYIKATATLTDTGDLSAVSTTAYAREADNKAGMDASQLTGSCSSYARKYALNGLLCIDDNKDADTTNTTEKAPAKKKAATPAPQKPAITEEMYKTWAKAAAEGRPMKNGKPIREGFIETFAPSQEQLTIFDNFVNQFKQ